MSPIPYSLKAAGLFVVLYLAYGVLKRSRRKPFPPGPVGLPVIGNLFDWPKLKMWETFGQWARTYGDIVHVNVAGKHILVINSIEAASALLHAKGSAYSDRPPMHFLANMVGWRDAMIMMDSGPEHRGARRLFEQQMGTKAVLSAGGGSAKRRIQQFLRKLSANDDSDVLIPSLRMLFAGIILESAYGYPIEDDKDNLIERVERVMHDFSAASKAGAHLVDTIPWLEHVPLWVPGTGFKKEAEEMRHRRLEVIDIPYRRSKEYMMQGSACPSLVTNNLEGKSLSQEEEHTLKNAAADMFFGGADTTVSFVHQFFLLMALNPQVQAKAQAELDLVVGSDRLPTFADKDQLPYTSALFDELLRLGSVTPQAAPHYLREGDVYNGYVMPKGSIVFANTRSMSRDSRHYRDPEVFDPSRFLGDKPEMDPREYCFGFGRRLCPGRRLAEQHIFVICAMTLATMNISRVKSIDNEQVPELVYYGGMITHAEHFPCHIRSRSSQAETLLKNDVEY